MEVVYVWGRMMKFELEWSSEMGKNSCGVDCGGTKECEDGVECWC